MDPLRVAERWTRAQPGWGRGCPDVARRGWMGWMDRLPGWAAENGGGMVAACGYAMENRGAMDVPG